MQAFPKYRYWLLGILMIALLLRVGYALTQETDVYIGTGGDIGWYLANGFGFFTGQVHGYARGIPFYLSTIPTAPLYLIFVGFWQTFLPDESAIIAIRLVQSVMGVAICYFAYRIALILSREQRVGILVAGALAVHPSFVVESSRIATESLYLFLIAAGLWWYIEWVVSRKEWHPDARIQSIWTVMLVGLALGLATLTRAALLVFPVGLFIHMLLVGGRSWLKRSMLLLVVYVAVISIWTIYNLQWGRLVIASDQFAPALWRGATTVDEAGHEAVDTYFGLERDPIVDGGDRIENDVMLEDAANIISSDPGGFIRLRLSELSYSILQPHGTRAFGSESLKDLLTDWLQDDFSLDGLIRLTKGEGFWGKLVIYIFHYVGMVGGVIGMWLTRKRWQVSLVLIGFIVYTILIHVFLIALPRYIFPTEMFFWILAAVTLVQGWDRVKQNRFQFKRNSSRNMPKSQV